MRAGDEEVRMRPGEFRWFDNKAEHEAGNHGSMERIHLIFDLEPRDRILGPSPMWPIDRDDADEIGDGIERDLDPVMKQVADTKG